MATRNATARNANVSVEIDKAPNYPNRRNATQYNKYNQ